MLFRCCFDADSVFACMVSSLSTNSSTSASFSVNSSTEIPLAKSHFLAYLFAELFSGKAPPLSNSFLILHLEFWRVNFLQMVDYCFPSQSTRGTSFLCSKKHFSEMKLHFRVPSPPWKVTSSRFDYSRHLGRQAEVKLLPELLPAAAVVRFPAVAALSVTWRRPFCRRRLNVRKI